MLEELFWLVMNGSMVGYTFIVLVILTICLAVGFVWFYRKMPSIAKKILWNELLHHNPIVANCYDDQLVEFQTPRILSEGIFWNKDGTHTGIWHLHPKVPDELLIAAGHEQNKPTNPGNPKEEAKKLLQPQLFQPIVKGLESLYRKAFHIIGSGSRLYFAYSGKAEIVSPEILALMDNSELTRKNGETVEVKKDALLMALSQIKEDYVKVRPVFLTTFMDPRILKTWLPQSYGSTQLDTVDELVRQDERPISKGGKMNTKLIILVLIIGVGALAAIYFIGKSQGFF